MTRPIRDYIEANQDRYTREAITQELLAAGHDRAAIEAAWDEAARGGQATPARGKDLSRYVWIIYWLGAAAIAASSIFAAIGGGSGFTAFYIGWLVAYLVLTYWPARAMARARPLGLGGVLALIVTTPLLVIFIGGGICAATIAIIAGSLGR